MTTRTILKNVGSNSLGYVVNAAVGLLLSPIIRDSLGNAVTGVWTLIVSFVGYYGLLDIGIRSAVGHYVATYHARRDTVQVNRTLASALAMMLVVATVASLLTVVAAYALPGWYAHSRDPSGHQVDLSSVSPAELRAAILVLGLCFAVNFPMVLYSTVIYSVQRIDLQNAIGIGQVVVRAAATVWALRSGHGLVGLAAVVFGSNLLGWIAAIVLAHRVLPGLSLSLRHANRASMRELLAYGGFNVLVNVGDTVLLYTSSFVIMALLPTPPTSEVDTQEFRATAVTYYSTPASQLILNFMSIVQAITWSFTPYFTGRWATGAVADVRRLLDTGTRGVVLLASLIAGGLWFLGADFLRVWQGPSYYGGDNGPNFQASVAVLGVLTAATLLRASQSCGRQALFAMREVRYLGLLTLAEACANVVLSVVFVRLWGLVGIAVATLLPVIVTQGFIQPRHLLREIEMDRFRFAGDVVRAALPVVATMALAHWLLGERLAVHSWPTFLARGTILALPALVVGVFSASTAEERRTLRRHFAASGQTL